MISIINEKYLYIKPETARELLNKTKTMKAQKCGIERKAFLFDQYAVLSTSRLKLRNVTTRDEELVYFDELINTLMSLHEKGVGVVPILGYCFDSESENGSGYIFQKRARGEELFEDAVMKEYYVGKPNFSYLSSDINAEKYIVSRTNYLSNLQQKYYDKFISDMIVLLDNEILVDFNAKSNFFFDNEIGFQFIDLDSHSDYKYGLTEHKFNSKELVSYYGFIPCHFAEGTKVLPHFALVEEAVSKIGISEMAQLKNDNNIIFAQCKTALINNGVSQEQINESLKLINIYGF